MHANGALLEKLFAALGRRDHAAMASCYHSEARFRDIAFHRRGREQIHDMWRMICNGDIEVLEFELVEADDRAGRVRIVEKYTFHTGKDPPGDKAIVVNAIDSRFQFEDGRIKRQVDDCDAKSWARQALGEGMTGFLAGRIRLLRSVVAARKLRKFVKAHPSAARALKV